MAVGVELGGLLGNKLREKLENAFFEAGILSVSVLHLTVLRPVCSWAVVGGSWASGSKFIQK